MRKNTLLVGVLSLLGTSQAMADDWVIELMKSNASHIELVIMAQLASAVAQRSVGEKPSPLPLLSTGASVESVAPEGS